MSYIEDDRRWFEDQHPRFKGRLLEVYWDEGGRFVRCGVHWRNGRPNGAKRTWTGDRATLESKRFVELTGVELERARRGELRRG